MAAASLPSFFVVRLQEREKVVVDEYVRDLAEEGQVVLDVDGVSRMRTVESSIALTSGNPWRNWRR